MPILRLTDGEERLLLSVYDLWQHERLLVNRRTGVRRRAQAVENVTSESGGQI